MNTANLSKTRKRAIAVVAVVALAVSTLGATFAWVDYNQHKSNELSGGALKYDARLVEDFDEIDDWRVEDGAVTKKISVANLGQAVDGYGSVYVRLQLKEYMEIGTATYTYTPHRYAIDTTGKFVIYGTLAAVQNAVSATGAWPGHQYEWLTDLVEGRSGYFIRTQDHDPNGQMGKHVATGVTYANPVKVINPGPNRATTTNHHSAPSPTNPECMYTVHNWMPGTDLQTREYIEWQLNSGDIITLTQWLDPAGPYKGNPVAKWVIDDTAAYSAQGWIYWGQALAPGTSTALLLESVSLIKQPEGSFYYVIHTDMEAVSLDEILNGNVDWGGPGNQFIVNKPSATWNGATPTSVAVGATVNSPGVTIGPAGAAQSPLSWSSSNPSLATVDSNGVVSGVAVGGPVTISVRAPNGARVSYQLNVEIDDIIGSYLVNIGGGNRTIQVGEILTFTCLVLPPTQVTMYTWTSSNPSVASINATGTIGAAGVLEALTAGTTTITVQVNWGSIIAYDSIQVTVVNNP